MCKEKFSQYFWLFTKKTCLKTLSLRINTVCKIARFFDVSSDVKLRKIATLSLFERKK